MSAPMLNVSSKEYYHATLRKSLRAIELYGRLGNQLFQFAALAALDDDVVRVEALRAGDWLTGTLRPDAYRHLTPRESLALGRPPVHRASFRRTLQRAVVRTPGQGRSGPLGRRVYSEPVEGSFDPGFAAAPAPVLYSGYFQNEDYFKHRPERVLDALVPPTVAVRPYEYGGSTPTCAVVIRAGLDYAKIGWDLPFAWYRDAAERVAAQLPACRYLVFSDVPIAAEAAAATLRSVGPASAAVGLSVRDQLHVIAACDHAVVASSTFAWWGAWLGDASRAFDPNRIVVAPDPWIFAGIDTVPARWTKLASPTRSDLLTDGAADVTATGEVP